MTTQHDHNNCWGYKKERDQFAINILNQLQSINYHIMLTMLNDQVRNYKRQSFSMRDKQNKTDR